MIAHSVRMAALLAALLAVPGLQAAEVAGVKAVSYTHLDVYKRQILFNAHELLYVAIREARAMAEAGYAPPPQARAIPVAGKNGIATFEMMLVNICLLYTSRCV